MPETLLITVIGGLLAVLQILVGYIFRTSIEDIKEQLIELRGLIDRDASAVLITRVDSLVIELGRLNGRFEQWVKEDRDFHYKWRHDEYTPAISEINEMLWPLPRQIEDMKTRLDRIEHKVFNGQLVK